jgi:putative component of toxin-antitoxin plasmid stabilization module
MNEHHRDVVDFLREYGATDIRLVPGGKHPKLTFEFRGKRVERVMSASPGDHRTSANAIAELRRALGDPVLPEPRVPRRLDDMTPATNGHAASASTGGMALYRKTGDGYRVRFFPPDDVADPLNKSGIAIAVGRISHDTWRLKGSDGISRPVLRRDGNKWQLDGGHAEELTRGFLAPFGASPAEYRVLPDGTVHVRLLTDRLVPVAPRTLKPKKPQSVPLINPDRVEIDAQEVGMTLRDDAEESSRIKWVEPPKIDPRDVLILIAEVERSTAYRLVRLKEGGWAWQAPLIKLDGC